MREVRRLACVILAAAGLWFAHLTFTTPLDGATAPAVLMIGCWFVAWWVWPRPGSEETGLREHFDRLFGRRDS